MSRTRSISRLMAACWLILWGAGGCGSSDTDAGSTGHTVPAHKPESFAALVDQLERRIRELPSSGDDPAVRELGDIIGWIPELAADSDLRRAQFEKAAAIGARMQETFAQDPNGLRTGDNEEVRGWLRELRDLVPLSEDRHR